MPTITLPAGAFAAHSVSLTANVETIIDFGVDASQVEVVSITSAEPVYFTVDGTAVTVAGATAYALFAGLNSIVVPVPGSVGLTRVRLISAAAATVSAVRAA